MAGNCQKLKFNRRRMRLTQNEFARLVGVDVKTIDKLERDEAAWDSISDEITDKIYAQYSSMASYQPDKEERQEALGVKEETKSTRNEGSRCIRLRYAREKMGLSQKALANQLGLSVQTIYQLERDETRWATVKSETADKIMNFYDSLVSDNNDSKEEKRKNQNRKQRNSVIGPIL